MADGDLALVDVYGLIRRACREAGSQQAWALEIGVSPAYVSAVLNGTKPPSDALLAALGVRRTVIYRWVNPK